MFSVITISRDRPDAFLNHLLSLKKQLSSVENPWELIVLDDSTVGNDGQEEVIKAVCSKDMPCEVKAFRALNRIDYGGEGKTINYGVKQSKGDPIFVLCGDDVYPSFHLHMMTTIWNRFKTGGMVNRVLGWPLYHLKPFCRIETDSLLACDIDSTPEMIPEFLARRETRFPDAPHGLDVVDSLIDDRCCYSREFLFNIKGWPEWRGCWWRDAWFTAMAGNLGYQYICDWASWALHQWHPRRAGSSVGDGEAKAYYDELHPTAKVSNEGAWGEAEIREIELD